MDAVKISVVLVLVLAMAAAAVAQEDSSAWRNANPPFDLEALLSKAAQMERALASGTEETADPEFVYPALNKEQARFAVNPGYKEFYDLEFRPTEDMKARSQEVAPAPSSSDVEGAGEEPIHHDKFPKKASAVAMARSTHGGEGSVEQERLDDIWFTTIAAVSSALAVFAIVGAGFCYHRVRRNSKASEDVEYPAYGVTGPGKETSPTSGTDRKLAQNAQLYHYQHQKQQMIAFDSANGGERRNGANGANGANASDCESDDGEEGDYTVYECPGLAPAGEMEVHNPLFQDDPPAPVKK